MVTLHFKSSRKAAQAHLKISWELVMQRYARHRRFIFSISAIYLEAAHKQNSSYPRQPLHHTRNTSACFCFICRLSRGTDLIWLYFYSLQFIHTPTHPRCQITHTQSSDYTHTPYIHYTHTCPKGGFSSVQSLSRVRLFATP